MQWLQTRLTEIFLILLLMVVIYLWWQGPKIAQLSYRVWVDDAVSCQSTSPQHVHPTQPPSLPSFTDTYSAIGALFSGLAFAAVLWTLLRQEQHAHHGRCREQFYQLLNAWQTAAHDIRYKGAQGNDGFLNAENDLLGDYNAGRPGALLGKLRARQNGGLLSENDVIRIYRKFYEEHIGGSLAYIFRVQYQILSMVHKSGLPKHVKRELADIYRSMLSDPELHLMLYFSLSSYAPANYRGLISRYGVLDVLLHKEEQFIRDRIPEITYIPGYEDWPRRRKALRQVT